MAGIELEELKADKAEYLERILNYEDSLQEYQSKVQELQTAIIHTRGALAQVNTNIRALEDRAKEEERARRETEGNDASAQAKEEG